MGIVDLIVIGIAVLVAFAIGAPQFLRLLFNRAKVNMDIASRNPEGVPNSVAAWETKLVAQMLQDKRTEAAKKLLMEELAEIAKPE